MAKMKKTYNTKFVKNVKHQELSSTVEVNWCIIWRIDFSYSPGEDVAYDDP